MLSRNYYVSGYDPEWRTRTRPQLRYIDTTSIPLTPKEYAARQAGKRPELPEGLLGRIAKKHGCSVDEITGTHRNHKRYVCGARLEAIRQLRALGWTYPQIGFRLNRSRTGIQSLLRKYWRKSK